MHVLICERAQVSVPDGSMLAIVTVRCGHCANLLSVNMGALLQSHVHLQDFQVYIYIYIYIYITIDM